MSDHVQECEFRFTSFILTIHSSALSFEPNFSTSVISFFFSSLSLFLSLRSNISTQIGPLRPKQTENGANNNLQRRRRKYYKRTERLREGSVILIGKFYWPLCGRSFSLNLPLLPLDITVDLVHSSATPKTNENNLPYISIGHSNISCGLPFFFSSNISQVSL